MLLFFLLSSLSLLLLLLYLLLLLLLLLLYLLLLLLLLLLLSSLLFLWQGRLLDVYLELPLHFGLSSAPVLLVKLPQLHPQVLDRYLSVSERNGLQNRVMDEGVLRLLGNSDVRGRLHKMDWYKSLVMRL